MANKNFHTIYAIRLMALKVILFNYGYYNLSFTTNKHAITDPTNMIGLHI